MWSQEFIQKNQPRFGCDFGMDTEVSLVRGIIKTTKNLRSKRGLGETPGTRPRKNGKGRDDL